MARTDAHWIGEARLGDELKGQRTMARVFLIVFNLRTLN